MRNVNTPPRRKSVINVFTTPPLRRSSHRKPSGEVSSASQNQNIENTVAATNPDDSDDENFLTAMGDISLSYPYFVPGAAGALSPKPRSRHGTPKLRAEPQRPRPPLRRSVASDSYKFRTLMLKAGLSSATPNKDALNNATQPSPREAPDTRKSTPASGFSTAARPGHSSNPALCGSIGSIESEDPQPSTSFCGSTIGSIESEDPQLSTPQSRFEAFMRSRDLTRSPQKVSVVAKSAEVATSAVEREAARPKTRPLRGNARLPPRLPIPNWGAMEVDAEK
ncbi:hypothetical protein MSAN_01656100 [Mycena sanguinolenta]|uniref:Uncharacterized protein n=1 Tax=Mycena sanguinolenta TaxID=230812 RepID=A0A8H6Y1Z3_9AGAR|nr:hypothetical protein MSAN_01656100 [Mycena sanguinolenta]